MFTQFRIENSGLGLDVSICKIYIDDISHSLNAEHK